MEELQPFLRIELAPYAMDDSKSAKKRKMPIKDNYPLKDFRTEFQRDRDRIIHSKAFRRLESKTQVVISHESDHNRKRLTHSLEVSQISGTIACNLGLNIFLTEAIALGHDLGHTAFGHGGEEVLTEILKDFNKQEFKHNYQSVLVVNKLERRYGPTNGLNLMWETRDGILKHTELNPEIDMKYYDDELEADPAFPLTLEGQVVRLVDEIAQRTHDTDDGLSSGRISFRKFITQPLIKEVLAFANEYKSKELVELYETELYETDRDRIQFYLIRSMIKFYIADLLKNTRGVLEKEGIKTYQNVENHKDRPIVSFSNTFQKKDEDFEKGFLKPSFYDHYEIKRMDSRGKYFLRQMFKAFKENPKQLPIGTFQIYRKEIEDDLKKRADKGELNAPISTKLGDEMSLCEKRCRYIPNSKLHEIRPTTFKKAGSTYVCPLQRIGSKNRSACEGIRVIINHIAGMTDRYAALEFARLYLPPEISRS